MNSKTIYGDYMIDRGVSPFTSRNNGSVKRDDVWVWVTDERPYGLYFNGRYYNSVLVLKAESGDTLRGRVGSVPAEIARLAKEMCD